MKEKKVYIINKANDKKYQLCKVLNDYDTLELVNKDLVSLLTDKTNEKQLLKEYKNK